MIRVSNIKVDVRNNDYKSALIKKLHINENDILNIEIHKRSIDARKEVMYVYELDVILKDNTLVKYSDEVKKFVKEEYKFDIDNLPKDKHVVIVGCGPAGLFCAYELSKRGVNVTLIDRGSDVDSRAKTIDEFWKSGKLNTNSNVQFGEGGAGTFSDGKLTTGIKDKNNRIVEVLNTFYECGANENIKYDSMPHIGTDTLRIVIKNLRNKIISNGGKVRFNTLMSDIIIKNNKVYSIIVNNNEEILCDKLVLALGHSARDTFRMIYEKGIELKNKPFAVGFRVCHNQSMIDENQYGKYKDYLGPASYKLTYNEGNRGVYSFCMCPGGYVVNASSEKGKLAINGMSYSKRDSHIANSAIIVTVNENDYGTRLFDGVKYQENIEEKAFNLCNGKIPTQLLIDYKNNVKSTHLGSIIPCVKGEYELSNLNSILSKELNDVIKNSFTSFNNKIKGFSSNDTILLGIESRTSSAIRIIRNEKLMSNIEGIYPCGEGAGYAGGITSASVDGIKVFESIISEYE